MGSVSQAGNLHLGGLVPFLSVMVRDPSMGLNSPLHVASPDCATLNSIPSAALALCPWLLGLIFSYTKHLNRSSFEVEWPWCILPTRYQEVPSFHRAMHCSSST
uniref:Uncharacterized protein n=1 Tax=Cacopsylla melanoneura TaxID=428564 RepID=A0A8D8ZM63_9HEMI